MYAASDTCASAYRSMAGSKETSSVGRPRPAKARSAGNSASSESTSYKLLNWLI